MRDGMGFFVWVARPTGSGGDGSAIATAVPVRIAFETPDRLVVEAPDLAAGDLVVVEGNERLRAGQPVQPIEMTGSEEGRESGP